MCTPPKNDLLGVPPGSLLKLVKGACGLREAPRLWYRRARAVLLAAGMDDRQTVKARFVSRDPTTRDTLGVLVRHVGVACIQVRGDDGVTL